MIRKVQDEIIITGSRKSKEHNGLLRTNVSEVPPFYTHMLTEDVQLMILPYEQDGNENPIYSVQLSPHTSALERAVLHSFSNYEGDFSFNLKSIISSFIREVAYNLVDRGNLFFEILEGKYKGKNEKIFIPVPIPGKIIPLGFYYFQILQSSSSMNLPKKYIPIPRESVWHISIPSSLGGVRECKRIHNTMKEASEFLPRDLRNKEWAKEEGIISRINEYDQIRMDLLARATIRWGWNARDSWKDKSIEYYRIYREVQFAKTLALLRESITSEMNAFLKRVGVQTEIKISGLPSSNDISGLITSLQNGKVSFAQVFDVIRSE
jgi:hypothetical protein